MSTQEPETARPPAPPTEAEALSIEDAYPLATLQSGMLFHGEFEADSATYHDVFTAIVRGPFDPRALRNTLTDLLGRHPLLRTSFNFTDFSQPLQLVHQGIAPLFTEHDLAGEDPDAARAALVAWRESEKHQKFDLSVPPLFRIFVHHLPQDLHAATLSFHHAILDGWSVARLATEAMDRYIGHLTGQPLAVEPLPVTYQDFVAAERAAIEDGAAREHWRATLPEAALARIPRRPGYPTGESENMRAVETVLPPALVAGLAEAARSLHVPLRTVLFAAHLKVIAAVTGTTDPICGLVTHGRPEDEAGDEILGLFLNVLPLHVSLEACDSWTRLVRAVYTAESAAVAHRRYPLFEIQRAVGVSPLFETLFDYRDFFVYNRPPGQARPVQFVDQLLFEQIDLPLAAGFSTLRDGGLVMRLPHDTSQFPYDQVLAIRDLYLGVLGAIAADLTADPRPNDALLAADAARIEQWNATTEPFEGPQTLDALIARQVAASPHAPALCFRSAWLDYASFGARVNRLARHLRATGVQTGSVVGVCLDRGVDMVVSLHAVIAAGAAYLPLEPAYPDERLAFLAQDADARHIITDKQAAARFTEDDAHRGRTVIQLDEAAEAIAAHSPQPLGEAVPAQAPAYIIHTSGSTGVPKGVLVPHAAIVNRLRWMQQAFPLGPADRVLHKTPFSFDVSVWELFWPLTAGAGLVLADPGGHRDAAHLADLVDEHGVTTAHFVPSLLEALLEDTAATARLGRLRRVVCSGEALSPALADRFRAALPGVELHNLYGPTEAAVDVTWHPCAPDQDPLPIGRPIANTRIEILDRRGGRVPIGTPGELCIGGVQLALGYLNRPALTAERFVPDPYGPPGSRLYRSGDLARHLPDGEIDYLGRVDDQVKLRGFRSEPGEIEAALAALPGVRNAAVVLRDDGSGPRLVAYLAPAVTATGCAGEPPVTADLSETDFPQQLRHTLPEHLIPGAFVVLEQLPLTPSGKLDRAALPAPQAPRRAGYRPPRDQVEATLATVWQQLLGVPAIGIDEDFFELGGHSLLALRLALRVRQELGRDLPVAAVLTSPTIRLLGEELRRPEDLGRRSPIVALRTTGDRPPIFLLHALGGQVFRYRPLAARLGEDQPVYTIPAHGLAPGETPHHDMAEMIEDYLGYIREVRPHGPYVFGGFCIGGNIALELARRLRAEGEQVPLVVPVWSSMDEPVVMSSLEDETMLMIHAIAGGVDALRTVDLDHLRSLSTEERLVAVIQASAKEQRLRPDTADIEQARRYLDVFKANAHAVGYHKPEPYDGDVLYLQPTDDDEIVYGDDQGWRRIVTGRFEIAPLPGTRFSTLYEPIVGVMASQVRRWMDHGFTDDAAAARPAVAAGG